MKDRRLRRRRTVKAASAPISNPLRSDPSRTATLQRVMLAELKRRFDRLKVAIVREIGTLDAARLTQNVLTVNDKQDHRTLSWEERNRTLPEGYPVENEFTATSDPAKVVEFQRWLRTQFADSGLTDEQLWERYTQAGYRKGQGRAWDDFKAKRKAAALGDAVKSVKLDGAREDFLSTSFNSPVAVEKVQLLAGRAFDDLENVTTDMSTRMSRVLTDGMVQGLSPRDVGSMMAKEVDIGRKRATTIARTECIRAFAEGQLDALEGMGVDEVGVKAEWDTSGLDNVCELCSDLEGTVLTIAKARGLIPRHPNCACVWLPALPDDLLA